MASCWRKIDGGDTIHGTELVEPLYPVVRQASTDGECSIDQRNTWWIATNNIHWVTTIGSNNYFPIST